VASYRFYHIDGAGRFSTAEWIEASDDADAIAAARKRRRAAKAELWQGSRLVARIGEGE
jgi:hypothetical protein